MIERYLPTGRNDFAVFLGKFSIHVEFSSSIFETKSHGREFASFREQRNYFSFFFSGDHRTLARSLG